MNKLVKIVFILGIFALIFILFVSMSKNQQMVLIQSGNTDAKPLEIKLGHFQDSDCGMVIISGFFVLGYYVKNGVWL